MCDHHLIALSALALDYDVPSTGWGPLLDAEGIEAVEDSIGRPAIASADAARLLGAQRAAAAYAEDQRRHWEAKTIAAAVVPRGVPAIPGMSAFEQMLLADEADRPKSVYQELLDDALRRGRT
jgi:hypothetical protein